MRFKVRKGINIAVAFKYKWLLNRKRTITALNAESILAAKGIEIVDAKDVLRPALIEEPFFPLEDETNIIAEEKPPCYMLTNSFRPLASLDQSQLITNSLVFNFPDSFLEKVEETTDEEKEMLKDIVLQSLMLDAQQNFLPRDIDVHNLPGYIAPRMRGIRKEKKIENIVYYMLNALERKQAKDELRHILHKATSKVTLPHHDKLMHLDHVSEMFLCTKRPLQPFAGPDEVTGLMGTSLPDIYPLSPFIHSNLFTSYSEKEGYAVPGAVLAPHTVFMGNSYIPFLVKPQQFYSMSLVYAFSFAASYAKEKYKGITGDLEEPVTLNIVHTNGQYFHVGRFQLNTLDCSSPVRNIFWHEPWTSIYEKIGSEAARPVLENLNTRVYSLLKALN